MAARIPGRVLIFSYRKLNLFFHEVAARTFDGPITGCSFMPGPKDVGLQSHFYEYYSRSVPRIDLSEVDYEQIIGRCSVLRLLPWEQSKRMVNAMYQVIDRLTDEARPDYLLTVSVDNYTTDLLTRVCKKKGARLLQFVAGSVDNTITLTSYGEFNMVRTPADEEVTRALARLLDDDRRVTYHFRFTKHSLRNQLMISSRWWAKCVCFKAASWLRRDPLNFLFLLGTIPARDGQSSLWTYKAVQFFHRDWEERIARRTKPTLFIPLGYFPEMSVSYWLNDLRYSDYENFVVDSCRELSKYYAVIVKEHWSAMGARRWPFYRRLQDISGVTLIPPEVNSRLVMQQVDLVLVGSGSSTTGLEAALRGKRVATLDQPYYYLEGHYLNVGSPDGVLQLPALLEAFKPPPNTDANRRRLVTRLLESTLIGHMLPDGELNREENFRATSESLKTYLSCEASHNAG